MGTWHEQDSFWETMPMFGERQIREAGQEVDSILDLLAIAPGSAVLDLCCGIGRHSVELARRGFRVTGVDRTAAYLRIASEKARREGLDVEWVQADMREFMRPGAYAAALNLSTSFGFFEDPVQDRQVVTNVHSSLEPGGRLLVDIMGKEVLARIFQPRDWQELPDGSLFLQERKIRHDWTWMEGRWILIRDGQRQEYTVDHRIYDGAGLRDLLLGGGFASVELYGGLEGVPYDTKAGRLVALAHKSP